MTKVSGSRDALVGGGGGGICNIFLWGLDGGKMTLFPKKREKTLKKPKNP